MDPTEPPHGRDMPGEGRPARSEADIQAQARLDRRAEALRANLKRRKAQVRGRAEADRAPAID